ncbi:MAG: lysylphosphatidylglycerol synthase domain-containing protein [Pseudomonadota bacterium]
MLRWALPLRLGAAVLIVAVLALVLDLDALLGTATALEWETLALASLLMFGGLPVAAARWHLILIAVGGALAWLEALRLTCLSMLVALGLPSGQGGDLVRGAMLAACGRASLAQIVSSTLADRLYGLLSIGLVACRARSCWPSTGVRVPR